MKQPLILCIAAMLIASCTNTPKPAETVYEQQSPDFNADSAYLYIAEQCAFGPRVMNSEAHDACADYIAAKFESFGAQIVNQDAEGVLYDGTKVRMRNIKPTMRIAVIYSTATPPARSVIMTPIITVIPFIRSSANITISVDSIRNTKAM